MQEWMKDENFNKQHELDCIREEDLKASTGSVVEDGEDGKQPPVRRAWTSQDDGWGMHRPFSMQDLEKMPMGMPLTVGELADFLLHACESVPGTKDEGSAAMDMLDWSLAQWRAHRLNLRGEEATAESTQEAAAESAEEPASRLQLEEQASGPVLVHRVPFAPPRPILCIDDPEASLLRAAELLLAYPELDALPIVSPVRGTVVAHLTLSYCLAYAMSSMCGQKLLPLAQLAVSAAGDTGAGGQRLFCGADAGAVAADGRAAGRQPWVLGGSQPLRELLAFFARTPHSVAPVVDDKGGGGVLGLLGRRDLLDFLDLATQTSRRSAAGAEAPDGVSFNTALPIQAVLEALRNFRTPLGGAAAAAGGTAPDESRSAGFGAAFAYEEELTLRALLPRVLTAENRKLVFVRDCKSGGPPELRRLISVSDVWRLCVGDAPQLAKAGISAGGL